MSDQQNSGVVVAVRKRRTARFLGILRRINPKNLSPKGRKILIGLLITSVVLASTGTGVLYVKEQRSPSNQCNGREDSQIYKRAGSVMNPSAVDALGKVVRDMESMQRFSSDPTCLYVASIYSLNVGRLERAREYYRLLREVSSKKQIIPVGPEQIKTMEQLDFEITKAEQRSKTEYENMKLFSEGPSEQL